MTYYMILLIIISNNILLSPSIAFTYHLITNNLFIKYTKFYLSIIENRLFFIVLLKSTLACHLTIVLISTHQYAIYWSLIFHYLNYFIESCN